MRYVWVLLAASIGWTAPAFAESGGPTPAAPAAAAPPPGLDLKYKDENQAEFEAQERRCLAVAIYFEARDGPIRRQIGVGQVILNRVRNPRFPQTICGVVYQDQMSPNCQFPFACDGRPDVPEKGDQWALAQKLARQITSGQVWLPDLGYSTSLKDALAIGVPSEPSNREEDAHVAVPPPQSPPSAEPSKGKTVVATGTGFIINDRGDVVTNNHVVDGCSLIKFVLNGQGLVQGRLVTSDTTNDLAVANFPLPRTKVASFSDTVKSRPGDDLVVFGYPLLGLLSTSGNLTRGS